MNMTDESPAPPAADGSPTETSLGDRPESDRPASNGSHVGTRRRRIVPIVLAAFLVLAVTLILLEIRGYKAGVGGEPGPAALPLLIGALSLVAAIALVIQSLRGAHDNEDENVPPVITRRVLTAIAALVAAGLLLEQIGFFVVFTGLGFITSMLSGAKRWWTALILGAVASWMMMIVFGRIFSVPLPASPIDVSLGG